MLRRLLVFQLNKIMKIRLPKVLLVAVLAGMFTVAEGTETPIIRPYQVDTINEGTVEAPVDITEDFVTGQEGATSNVKTSAYAKDGSGVAQIKSSEDITIKTRLLVREGTLLLNDTTINVTRGANGGANDGGGALMVGGKDNTANLTMDNSHWVGKAGYNDSVNIGNGNGGGSVTLNNGSSITMSQALFMGHPYSSSLGNHMYQSYASADTTDTTIYGVFDANNTTPGHGELNINSGSSVITGTAYYLGDATINLSGSGSSLQAAQRDVGNTASMGRSDNGTTAIKIADGAQFITATKTKVGRGANSTTTIDVTGANSLFKATHIFQMGDNRMSGEKSQSTITVDNGGTADIAQLVMHGNDTYLSDDSTKAKEGVKASANHEAHVVIKEGGSYKGFSVEMNSGTSFTNNGTVELTNGAYVSSWRDDNGWYGTTTNSAVYTEVDAKLVMNGGKLVNSGSITIDGALTMSGGAELSFDITDLSDLPSLTVDSLSVNDATISLIFVDVAMLKTALGIKDATAAVMALADESVVYSGTDNSTILNKLITFSSAEGLADAENSAENITFTLKYKDADAEGGYIIYEGSTVTLGDVANAVPEPTTTTLSLLALAGLCARRRRR